MESTELHEKIVERFIGISSVFENQPSLKLLKEALTLALTCKLAKRLQEFRAFD